MSPIRRFLAWWLSELRAMLPGGGHRDAGLGSGRRVRVTVDEHAVVVSRVDGSRVRELGRLPGPAAPPDPSGVAPVVDLGRLSPRDTPCELAVASELALSKEVDLPGAAQENLGEVLAFEMERLTPFRAADVLYDYRVLGRRDGGKRVRVRLSVVPRRLVAPALAAFPGWDLRAVTGAGVEPGDGGEVRLLLRSARYRERGGTWLVGILALVNLGLLAGVLAVPLAQQRGQLAAIDARLEAARARAAASSLLEERIAALRSEIEALHALKSARPSAVEVIDELTRLLPDETWLYRLELKGGKVLLQGSSGQASALVGALEASPLLSDARFDSPVVREGAGGRERFQLSAQVEAIASAEGAAGDEPPRSASR